MKSSNHDLGRVLRAAALSASVAAIALIPLSAQSQTTESAAYAVAKNAQSADATLKFIEAYPQSPLAVELLKSLPAEAQMNVCIALPDFLPLDEQLYQTCAQVLNILPAAGPARGATAGGRLISAVSPPSLSHAQGLVEGRRDARLIDAGDAWYEWGRWASHMRRRLASSRRRPRSRNAGCDVREPGHLEAQALDGALGAPLLEQRHRPVDVAVLLPLRVEVRRLRRDADVLGERGDDALVPHALDVGARGGGVDGHGGS